MWNFNTWLFSNVGCFLRNLSAVLWPEAQSWLPSRPSPEKQLLMWLTSLISSRCLLRCLSGGKKYVWEKKQFSSHCNYKQVLATCCGIRLPPAVQKKNCGEMKGNACSEGFWCTQSLFLPPSLSARLPLSLPSSYSFLPVCLSFDSLLVHYVNRHTHGTWASEMAWCIKALAAKTEELSSIPGTRPTRGRVHWLPQVVLCLLLVQTHTDVVEFLFC